METEDLVLNDSSQRQVVEQLCELLPHIGISVLSQALIIETIPNFTKYLVRTIIMDARVSHDAFMMADSD